MLSFGRKKITDDKVANVFVNSIIDSVEKGWPIIADFITDSPEFVSSPSLDREDYGKFLMIVIAGNFSYIPSQFDEGHDKMIIKLCIEKFASIFDVSKEEFALKVKTYRQFISRVNAPSKNTLYAMSKGVFFKYGLNDYQEEYFKSVNTPNPIFLKNLNDVMENYLWDWSRFKDKYKVISDPITA